jgi:hypothetical protein
MNFISILKDEHKEAKSLFKELLKQDSVEAKSCEILCKKLLLHMEMEEKFFYPKVKKIKETQELAIEAKLEHEEAKVQITALLKDKLDEIETKVKLETLQLEIEHHVEEEEKELFPLAEKALSENEIQEITEKMIQLKERSEQKAKH